MRKRKEWLVRPSRGERIALYIAAVLMTALTVYLAQRDIPNPWPEAIATGLIVILQLVVARVGVPSWLCD